MNSMRNIGRGVFHMASHSGISETEFEVYVYLNPAVFTYARSPSGVDLAKVISSITV